MKVLIALNAIGMVDLDAEESGMVTVTMKEPTFHSQAYVIGGSGDDVQTARANLLARQHVLTHLCKLANKAVAEFSEPAMLQAEGKA
jgi:bifunctional ADP-heptose synthase (sugar kinase/adenylyltransferase)